MSISANSSFYTQRADRALAVKVERITGKTDSFATNFMGHVDDKNPACTRLVATRDPDTHLWDLKRHTRLNGDATGMTLIKTEARTGLCFFDALHYLARFQTTEADLGKQPCDVIGEGLSTLEHYTKTARDAGQAIDADGEVHPCAYGHILTDGFFDDAAIKAAASTKNATPIPAAPPGNFVESLNKGLMQQTDKDSATSTDLTTKSVNRRETINKFKDIMVLAEKFNLAFRTAVGNDFKTDDPVFNTFLGTVSLGIYPAIGYLRGNTGMAPVRGVYKALNDLSNATDGLPDCPEKTAMQEFNRAASYAISMERAAAIHNLCQEQKLPPKAVEKGLPFIARAASIIGLGDTDHGRLKTDYLNGKVIKGAFKNETAEFWGTHYKEDGLYRRFLNRVEALENNAPV